MTSSSSNDPVSVNASQPTPVIAVVIPAYRVERWIGRVIEAMPPFVRHIIVVDDQSDDQTSRCVREANDPRVILITHEHNQGVGGAVLTGYAKSLDLGAEIVVKMDGDHQMDPKYLPLLLEPVLSGQADYAKGNRFMDLAALKQMPPVRRFGNTALTFMAKLASGYWSVCDPTNGYTALRRETLEAMDFSRLHPRYFFETSMLIHLNILRAVVRDVPIPARYGDETSSLHIRRVLLEFPGRLIAGFCSRVYWRYMLMEFAPLALFLLIGLPSLLFGLFFGLWRWWISITTGQVQSTGTVILAMLPFLLGFQLVLQAMIMDMQSEPRVPLAQQRCWPRLDPSRSDVARGPRL